MRQNIEIVPKQDLVDHRRGQSHTVKAPELRPDPSHAKAPLAAQREDQLFCLRADLLGRGGVRLAAQPTQAGFAILIKAAQPFPQRRPRDAEAAADRAGISDLTIRCDPCQPLSGGTLRCPFPLL